MVYIDSSSLLKTIWKEPESFATLDAIGEEGRIWVSVLTELEAEVQIRGRWLGGDLSKTKYEASRKQLQGYRETEPFHFIPLASSVFQTALQQHLATGKSHCRTLDRLHLAAMQELGIRRLMTHDTRQALAARALGFEVITPE